MRSETFCLLGLVCLAAVVCVAGLQAQERPQVVVEAAPVSPSGDGRTTLGTAPDLSVFSVMKFAGTLKDSSGEPRTGAVGITFAFYSEQTGGAPLWLETQNIQLDAQGRYSALLGATKTEGLPLNLFSSGEARWLGIQVGTEAEQQRILLVSVPYALKAAEAERLGGKTADEFVSTEELEKQVQQAVETQVAESEINLAIPGGTKEIAEVASTFTDNNSTEVVLVTQSGTGRGLRATSTSGTALEGTSTATTGVTIGVLGLNSSTGGKGLFGVATAATGVTVGLQGQVNSPQGTGVYGRSLSLTGRNFGVRGETLSDDGQGVVGHAKSLTGVTFGVVGLSDSTSGRGLQGVATATTGTTVGLQGQVNSTAGVAIASIALATTGSTIGMQAVVQSASGVAGRFSNTAGGKLLSGISTGGAEVFSVDGSGGVTATSFTGAHIGDGSALTGIPSGAGGTVTDITAGAGLVATATNPITVTGTLAIDTAVVPRLGVVNTFNANQTVNGTLTATAFVGDGSGLMVNAATLAEMQAKVDSLLNEVATLEEVTNRTFPSGSMFWAGQVGATGVDQGTGVAVDANGDLLATGHFSSTADFDPGPGAFNLASAGGSDVYLAKYAGFDGGLLWAIRFGSAVTDQGLAVAVDGNGDVFVTGLFSGTADFDPGAGIFELTSAGVSDAFLAKFSGADGSFLWVAGFGSTNADKGLDVAVDGSGNVLVTGVFAGTGDFDPGDGTTNLVSVGGNDVFLAKYSGTDGSLLWADGFGSTLPDQGNGVAVDSNGNVFVTGFISGTADFNPGAGTFDLTPSGADAFLAKYAGADGGFLWAEKFGAASMDQGQDVAVDSNGDVLVTGFFRDTADFDPGAEIFNLSGNSTDDVFVAKCAGADGGLLWAVSFGSTDVDQGFAIAVDGNGDAVVTGVFIGTVDFDPDGGSVSALTSNTGSRDIFVAKYAGADGSFLWADGFGNTALDHGLGVATGASRDVFVTGYFVGQVDFDPSSSTFNLNSASASQDVFLLKLRR